MWLYYAYMQRFFVDPECIRGNIVHVIDQNILHQMKRVLRVESNELCIFLDNLGMEYTARLDTGDRHSLSFTIIEKKKSITESPTEVILFQALPKKLETFEWILQKGTELGVSRFVPIITEYCNRRELHKIERLERIITEAAEQSERGIKPILTKIMNLKNALQENKMDAVVLHSRKTQGSFKTFLEKQQTRHRYALFIGPEGGFSSSEIQHIESLTIPFVSLGPRILRTETAAILACGMVLQT